MVVALPPGGEAQLVCVVTDVKVEIDTLVAVPFEPGAVIVIVDVAGGEIGPPWLQLTEP